MARMSRNSPGVSAYRQRGRHDRSYAPNYSSPSVRRQTGCDFYVVYYTRFALCVKRKISAASPEFA